MTFTKGNRLWIGRNGIRVHWRWTSQCYAKSVFLTWPWRILAMRRSRIQSNKWWASEWRREANRLRQLGASEDAIRHETGTT
jgi:hypothetical protein